MPVDDLLDALRGSRPRTSAELQRALGVSQAAVSRLIARAGDRVIRTGAARSTRYTLAVDVFATRSQLGLFEVSGTGIVRQFGVLRESTTGAYIVRGDDLPFWALGSRGDGVFGGLPYFLADLRPAGFLGRLNARRMAARLGASEDPREWTSAQIGRYLLQAGDDLPGNLALGEAAAEAANRASFPLVRDRARAFPERVQRNLDEEAPGSSAAGEQPKFLAFVEGIGHVIVKYSERNDTDVGRRWADLLAAEWYAHRVAVQHGLPAAESEIHRFEGRTYLESRRFDRVGRRGRRPALSLHMVDAEFTGEGSGWSRIATALHDGAWLTAEGRDHIVWLDTFGGWIGNTDRHPGNVSLAPTETGFALLPIYDMLPMRLSRVGDRLESIELPPPIRTPRNEPAWEASGLAAVEYWDQVASDEALSEGFRTFADRHARLCRRLLQG